MTKLLVIAGGGTAHLAPFKRAGDKLGVDVVLASFSDLEFDTASGAARVSSNEVAEFDSVYIRLVGKATEKAAFLAKYCIDKGIDLHDRAFADSSLPIPLSKSLEAQTLTNAGLSYPKTYFGSLAHILDKAPDLLGYPFVIKGTNGRQGHEVWSPRNEMELADIKSDMADQLAKFGKQLDSTNFIAQEFIPASQRSRVLVVGGKALAGITRPTRWRKRFAKVEGKRENLDPIPQDQADLAVQAAGAVGLDVAGVDILREDKTDKLYVLEVNSAPRWASIKADTGVQVEEEIVKFLVGK